MQTSIHSKIRMLKYTMIMVLGYFLFETALFGFAVALADVFGNLLQAAFSAGAGIALSAVLKKTRVFEGGIK